MITNFSFTELTKTDTGIKNVPDDMNVLSNLCRLAAFLQTIRNELHLPIFHKGGVSEEGGEIKFKYEQIIPLIPGQILIWERNLKFVV